MVRQWFKMCVESEVYPVGHACLARLWLSLKKFVELPIG